MKNGRNHNAKTYSCFAIVGKNQGLSVRYGASLASNEPLIIKLFQGSKIMFAWTYFGLFKDVLLLSADTIGIIILSLVWASLLAVGWTVYWCVVLLLRILSEMLDMIRYLAGNSIAALMQIDAEPFHLVHYLWEM